MSWPVIPLGELMASRTPSLDPAKYPDERFELWSIPAFDEGAPQSALGAEIGSAKKVVAPGDVLLSRIVPHIRRSWVVTEPTHDERQIASGEWIIFRSRHIDPDYMRHVLVGDPFHVQFMATVAGVGGSLLRARPEAVSRIEISLPPLSEQKRIAAILDTADGLRRLRRQTVTRISQIGESIFASLMDEISNPPINLQNFADVQVGYPFKSNLYSANSEGVSLCRGANVLPGQISWSDHARYPAELASAHSDFALREGDVVLAMDRPWITSGFKVARISHSDLPALLVQRVARVRARKSFDSYFLYFLMKGKNFQRHCRPTETTVPHISPVEVREFLFPLPSDGRRQRFEAEISAVAKLADQASQHLINEDRLFASLQHRAFGGEL